MQFAFFYPKDIQNFSWKTLDFVKNLEMTQIAGGWWGGGEGVSHALCVIMTQCVRKSIYDSPLTR